METVTVSEARANLPTLLNRVERGDQIQISRHGKPIAILIQPEEFPLPVYDVTAQMALIDQILHGPAQPIEPLQSGEGLPTARAEQIVDWIRQGRSDRP